MRRPPTALVLALLLAAPLSACGTGSDAPTDADSAEFCEAATALDDENGSGSERAQEIGEDLESVGTPAGIDEQAREGFEIQVDLLVSSGEDGADERDLSDDELNFLAAYSEFVSETCAS